MKTFKVRPQFKMYHPAEHRPTEWDEVKSILPGYLGLMLIILGVLYI